MQVECAIGCTSSQRINGLLNSQVSPAVIQGENKIELNCHAYLSKNERAVIEWFLVSDGIEAKISDLKTQTGNHKIKLVPLYFFIVTKSDMSQQD